jgi:hypothetical protein
MLAMTQEEKVLSTGCQTDVVGGEAAEWAASQGVPFVFKHEGPAALMKALEAVGALPTRRPRAFIRFPRLPFVWQQRRENPFEKACPHPLD